MVRRMDIESQRNALAREIKRLYRAYDRQTARILREKPRSFIEQENIRFALADAERYFRERVDPLELWLVDLEMTEERDGIWYLNQVPDHMTRRAIIDRALERV